VVRLELLETGARGSLRIFGPLERGVERIFHADNCSELADALAFVIATLMTPEADDVRPAGQQPAPTTAKAPPAEERARFRFGGGMSLGAYTALSPELLPVPRAGLRIVRTRNDDRGDAWAAQLSIARATSGRLRGRLGDAELTFFAARGELCGPSWGTAVRVSACALLDVGQLTGVGFAQYDAATKHSLWLSPGMLGRAELRLADALCLIVDAGATVPLVRPRFFFAARNEEETLHEVPFVAAFAEIGVSALLP
jgi:hypothetical protein